VLLFNIITMTQFHHFFSYLNSSGIITFAIFTYTLKIDTYCINIMTIHVLSVLQIVRRSVRIVNYVVNIVANPAMEMIMRIRAGIEPHPVWVYIQFSNHSCFHKS